MASIEERQQIHAAAALFKVLGHPDRVQILELLIGRTLSISEITEQIGISQSYCSKHLSQMKEAGLVMMEKQGSQVMCSLGIRCADLLLECAKRPDRIPQAGSVPVPFRPGCE